MTVDREALKPMDRDDMRDFYKAQPDHEETFVSSLRASVDVRSLLAERDQLRERVADLGYRLEVARNLADAAVTYGEKVEAERDELRKALGEIEALDYRHAAVNGAAHRAHKIARRASGKDE